ncbi:MAG: FliM/FliN family flagellar motor switch protein [Pseudomonadota bacterium]
MHGPKMRVSGFPAMDPLCKAFASISATTCRRELSSGIDVGVYGFEVVRNAEYLKNLKSPSAIYILNFPATGGTGLIKAHPRLLGKVLDISLGGDGSFEEPNSERALTNIDLSIYGRFVDLISQAFHESVLELCGRSQIGIPVRSKFEEQPGMVRITPDRSEVFVIKLNFYIADDKVGAGLDLVIPLTTLEPLKSDLNSTTATNDHTAGLWATHMYDEVLNVQLPLSAVIDLGQFSVGDVSRLEQGMLLEIPANAIDDVRLRIETADGNTTLSHGRLGTKGRHKALRLAVDPDQSFIMPLIEMPRPNG